LIRCVAARPCVHLDGLDVLSWSFWPRSSVGGGNEGDPPVSDVPISGARGN
jgi:hypothetical protein